MTVRRDVPVVLGLWLITVVGQASVSSVTEVTVVGGRVHIQATTTSVSEVLDRLSKTTGMKIVYDGAPPSDRLTVAIDAGSETEALSRLLEGLGLTYAFKLDKSGRHVETLFVTSASSRRASSSATATASPSPRMTQMSTEDYDINGVEDEAAADPGNDPGALPPAVPDPSGMVGGNPAYANGQVAGQGGVPGAEGQDPNFPGAASFPSPQGPTGPVPPVIPGFPLFPGPVSYP